MALRFQTIDARRESRKERERFKTSIKMEKDFARQLRKIASKVGQFTEQFDPESPEEMAQLDQMLRGYAELIRPWAGAVSKRMITEASRKDEAAWRKVGKEMSTGVQEELRARSPVGRLVRALLKEQVELITSLPLDAAKRVHQLTLKNLEQGGRSKDIAAEIMRTGEVTQSRANLIARTEVARTSSLLTEARASSIGSEGYIWRTSHDHDVRKSHKEMEGKFVRWDSPPTLSDGTTTHAGQIYNCRCYPEPVIPDDI